jgi:hypothetical protein
MFFHGMDMKFVPKQFPCLFPDAHVSTKNETQLQDRAHLIERFGFEPVHLLESTKEFPASKCLQECFTFGEIVFAFRHLKGPIWQISNHEIAVPFLDIRICKYIFVKTEELRIHLFKLFGNQLVFLLK